MKKILCIIVFLLAINFAFAGGEKESAKSDAESGKMSIVIATDSTWPPFEFVNTDSGEIVGFTIDLVNAIAQEEGIEVEFRTTAWDGIFAGLDKGDYAMVASSVSITEERKEKMSFSDPYFNAGQILAVLKEQAGSITGLQDMVGKEVGAQIGTEGAAVVAKEEGVILKTYDALGPAIEELKNGTIDGIVADTPLISEHLLKNEKFAGLFETVGAPMTSEEYGFVFPKEGSEELLQKINSGLAKVKANGKYDEVFNKWMK